MIVESSLHLSGGELAALISACVGTPVVGVIAVMKLQANRLSKADAERAKQFERVLETQAERAAAQDAERSANFMAQLREREETARRRDELMTRATEIFEQTERQAREAQLNVALRLVEVSAALNKVSDGQARCAELMRSIAEVQARHDELLRRIARERDAELHQPSTGL